MEQDDDDDGCCQLSAFEKLAIFCSVLFYLAGTFAFLAIAVYLRHSLLYAWDRLWS